ncbi:homeobox Hox-B3-like protein [Tasmannia lanceolata]|uniref:homeobox Hox-B3-like protein n=1 Tax=Tasmannia lanceolata TaxID=3420 RepID=UPI004064381D
MAEIRVLKSNEELNQNLHNLESLFASLHPFSNTQNRPKFHQKTHLMQRGYMYEAYSRLRESKIQRKKSETEAEKTTPKKKVSFLGGIDRNKMSVAQSVPDFSKAIRKENKKPNSNLVMTPPPVASKVVWKGGGSKSASGAEKRGGGGAMVRKSCASLKELKGFSGLAASAIDEEGRGRIGKGMRSTILGHRQNG